MSSKTVILSETFWWSGRSSRKPGERTQFQKPPCSSRSKALPRHRHLFQTCKSHSKSVEQHVDSPTCRVHWSRAGLRVPHPRHRYTPFQVSRSWHMLTSSTASGLYYLSELVEEHTVFAKKLLTRLIYAVISIQVLLCLIDGFPFGLSLLSIVSHVVYLGNMRRFPIVKLSDPLFITSCGMNLPQSFTMPIC